MQDSWKQLRSDSTSWQSRTEPCREYILPRDEKSTDPKGWIRRNTKIGPVLEVTTSYLQGKHGVEIRIDWVFQQGQFSLVGQNFSWLEWKCLRWRRKYLLFQADQRPKWNQEDLLLLAHLPKPYIFVKEYGLILNHELNSIKLTQGKKNKHSSSTLRTTSRRRWSDRILETERWSSEQIWAPWT